MSLVHFGLKGRGVQLCWPDFHVSLYFVICFCFPNNFSWLSKGKIIQILTLEYQRSGDIEETEQMGTSSSDVTDTRHVPLRLCSFP